ncbi:MAG TPA: hypothetical protein VNZ52_04620 [Candidatus Thermoplasmatota archaeon]|nr:hypothetical protein [Candidatus Thermoplasmatota archaeon]
MAKTRRSNEPLKRSHWKSARTERRGRFAHGNFEVMDEDMAFRKAGAFTPKRGGRTLIWNEGNHLNVGFLTVDKSRLKWKAKTGKMSPQRLDVLKRTLHLRF